MTVSARAVMSVLNTCEKVGTAGVPVPSLPDPDEMPSTVLLSIRDSGGKCFVMGTGRTCGVVRASPELAWERSSGCIVTRETFMRLFDGRDEGCVIELRDARMLPRLLPTLMFGTARFDVPWQVLDSQPAGANGTLYDVLGAIVSPDELHERYAWTDEMAREFLPAAYDEPAGWERWLVDKLDGTFDVIDEKMSHEDEMRRESLARDRAYINSKSLTHDVVDKAIAAIHVSSVSDSDIRRLSLESEAKILTRHGRRDSARTVGSADAGTKRRWAVNYIRHELSNYDETLDMLHGMPGMEKEYYRYQHAVLLNIASMYPSYASECRNQMKHG